MNVVCTITHTNETSRHSICIHSTNTLIHTSGLTCSPNKCTTSHIRTDIQTQIFLILKIRLRNYISNQYWHLRKVKDKE